MAHRTSSKIRISLLALLHMVWGGGKLVTVAGVCRRRLSSSVTLTHMQRNPPGGSTRRRASRVMYR